MKRENLTENDPVLQSALKQWTVTEPLPPRFNERVWQGIARAEGLESANTWSTITNWLTRSLARPSMAVSYIVLLLGVGLLAGHWQAQIKSNHESETLSSRYVQMVDPYQITHH